MTKHRAGFLIAILMGLALTIPVLAAQPLPNYTVHIVIKNWSPNGVWMTAYMREFKDKIVGSWCVPPNQTVDRTFGKGQGPYKVIAEIKTETNCRGGTIKKLASDTNFNYSSTNFFFNRTITGRDSNAKW